MDKNTLDKFKQNKWYIKDMIAAFEKGKLIHSKSTPNKNVWIYECVDKKSKKDYVMKNIKRQYDKNLAENLCKQLHDMYSLYQKMQYKTNLGFIAGFDIVNDGNEFYIRIIMEKCVGTLKTFLQLGNRIKPDQFIEQFKSMTTTMFELEGRNISHKNLTLNNIYYIFNQEGRVEFKLFGFSNLVWGANDGDLSYVSPEEKYLMNTFEGSALSTPYDMDYFKVDSFNLGVTFLELIFLKEVSKWNFSLDVKGDPKMLDIYQNQDKLNSMIHENISYLKGHEFLFSLLKGMIHFSMQDQMNLMQSNVRHVTDQRIINEFKIMKKIEEFKENAAQPVVKKLPTIQEKIKKSKMEKFDKEIQREMKMTLGPILTAFRPNAVNRAYLLAWLASNATYFKYVNMYKTAVKDASDSKNSDAIFAVISVFFRNKIDLQKIFEIFVQDKQLQKHFIRYLKIFKPNLLKTFSDYFFLSDIESGYILYKKAFANDNKECQIEFVKLARQLVANNRAEKLEEIVLDPITEQVQFMNNYNVDVLATVNERLEEFYENNLIDKANKYIQEQNFSQRMVVIKQFKSLIRIKDFEKADQFIEKNNYVGFDEQSKKKIYNLDFQLIADQFYKAQQFDKAWKYILKIEDVFVACDILVGQDQTEKAIDHAVQNKNIDALQGILAKTKHEETRQRIIQLKEDVKKQLADQKKINFFK
ncbi:hypothetical protein ABPG74_018377 [Tetrahymena malaccensis]